VKKFWEAFWWVFTYLVILASGVLIVIGAISEWYRVFIGIGIFLMLVAAYNLLVMIIRKRDLHRKRKFQTRGNKSK
jgi:hypothetical protein